MKLETAMHIAKTDLKLLGFKKVRRNWWIINKDFYIAINIQVSIYDSETYYVNFGATPIKFYEVKFIPTNACIIQRRCGTNNLDMNHCIDKLVEYMNTDLSSLNHFLSIIEENKSHWLILKQMKDYIKVLHNSNIN